MEAQKNGVPVSLVVVGSVIQVVPAVVDPQWMEKFEFDTDKPLAEEMRRVASEHYGTPAKVSQLAFNPKQWIGEIDPAAEEIPHWIDREIFA